MRGQHPNPCPLFPLGAGVRVRLEPRAGAEPEWTPRMQSAWRSLTASNPRLHDGPIIAVTRFDPDANEFIAVIDRYKRLAVGAAGVWQLGVKGWVTGRDAAGREHLLIGRRSQRTRVYPGLWESAPAGGVEAAPGATLINADGLRATLRRESREELGLDAAWDAARPWCVVQDPAARSYDAVFILLLAGSLDTTGPMRRPIRENWEYTDLAWFAPGTAPPAGGFSPPTLALLQSSGWLDPGNGENPIK